MEKDLKEKNNNKLERFQGDIPNFNELTTYDKYKKCLETPPCSVTANSMCEHAPAEILYLKFLTVLTDFYDEFNENSTRDLFENKSNKKLEPHIIFIDEITENIANEIIGVDGAQGLVCENYFTNTKEYFVGNPKKNQSNKIMESILFALVFYILGSKQVQSILKKILKNVYKTYSIEHLLIVSMIVFGILYYVINLFI